MGSKSFKNPVLLIYSTEFLSLMTKTFFSDKLKGDLTSKIINIDLAIDYAIKTV